jgi:DNA-binding IclR family transcriptional regulator
VVELIDLMARWPDQSFSLAELSRRLGLHKQTCHSMLLTLLDAGWLVRHPTHKTYRLGPALVGIGRAAGAGSPVVEYANPLMYDLAEQQDAACVLLQRSGRRLRILDVAVTGSRHVAYPLQVGQELPWKAPIGGSLVAWYPDADVDEWIGEVPAGDVDHLRCVLAAVRERGYDVRLQSTMTPLIEELRLRLDTTGDPARTDHILADFVDGILGEADQLLHVDPGATYMVNSLSAPILDALGVPPTYALSIQYRGARELTGVEIAAIGGHLTGTTRTLSRLLGRRDRPVDA